MSAMHGLCTRDMPLTAKYTDLDQAVKHNVNYAPY
jgi:hypothetical protein